jgi:hypothetical protein
MKQTSMINSVNKFEDTKGAFRSHSSRKTDNTIAKRKRTNIDLQNTTWKNKD